MQKAYERTPAPYGLCMRYGAKENEEVNMYAYFGVDYTAGVRQNVDILSCFIFMFRVFDKE